MNKLLCITLVALSFTNAAICQEQTLDSRSQKKTFPYEVDFRFGHGAFPITYDFSPFGECFDDIDDYGYSLPGKYFGSQIYAGDQYVTGALSLSHSVRLKRWLELGVVATYYGDFRNIYSSLDNKVVEREYHHSFFFTPTIRFSWFRRECVRMYSSVGLGVGAMISKEAGYMRTIVHKRDVEFGPSIQLTGFGISVGKTFFGFAEAGAVGTLGLFTAGFGYRIKPKEKSNVKVY